MQGHDNHRKAAARVRDLLSRQGGPGQLLILEAGASPLVRFRGRRSDPRVTDVLDGYVPGAGKDSLMDALELVRVLVPGALEVHLFTDHPLTVPAPPDMDVVVHSLAGRGGNLAIVDAYRAGKRFSVGEHVGLGVRNDADQNATVKLDVRAVAVGDEAERGAEAHGADGSVIRASSFELKPGETRRVAFDLPEGTGPIRVRLRGSPDDLHADSSVLLLPERSPHIRARVDIGDAETSRAVARALRAAGARLVSGAADVCVREVESGDAGTATGEVEQFEGGPADGASDCTVATLMVQAPRGRAMTVAGPYVVRKLDPLARDLDLTGVYWTAGNDPDRRKTRIPLITVGDTALYARVSSRRLVLNINLSRSNLARHPAWPVLFANLVREVGRRRPGLARVNYRPGDALEYLPRSRGAKETVRVVGLQGAWPSSPPNRPVGAAPPSVSNVSIPGVHGTAGVLPERPGVYAVEADGERVGLVSVSAIAPDESDLRNLAAESSVRRVSTERGDPASRGLVSLSAWLVLLAVALVVVNWSLDRLEEVRHGI